MIGQFVVLTSRLKVYLYSNLTNDCTCTVVETIKENNSGYRLVEQ